MTRIFAAFAALAVSTTAMAAPRYVVVDDHGTLADAEDACDRIVRQERGATVRYQLATIGSAAELDAVEAHLTNWTWVYDVRGAGLFITDIDGSAPHPTDAMIIGPGGIWNWNGENVDAATAPSGNHYAALCERR
jgi:hypothetical protein